MVMEVEQHIVEPADEGRLESDAQDRPQAAGPVRLLGWFMWVLSMALLITSIIIAYAGDPHSFTSNLGINLTAAPTLIAYATVGAIIASRRPENPIGWIFCSAALLVMLGAFAEDYARYAVLQHPGSLPAGL